MLRIVVFGAVLLGLPSAAQAGCLIFCDEAEMSDPIAARAILAADLNGPLPEGITVIGLLQGGFQDRFIQAKLQGDAAATDAFLALADVKRMMLIPSAGLDGASDDPIWWDSENMQGLQEVTATTATLPFMTIAIAPMPGRPGQFVIYIFGFET